ncbi:AcrVA2 family anti-CRISPR protein [Faecalibaculum rodentium]|uniref:AcrVA2 family anti-CRISPR protein n=2 Tax=Faecalibaculum rodentium TaxID=1702221 RepID=UPI0026260106|nr:hypothetical protein [Faecalibaculum rodentium]
MAKRKKKSDCWPLEYCRQLKRGNPRIFEMVDFYRESSEEEWPSSCWVPLGVIQDKIHLPSNISIDPDKVTVDFIRQMSTIQAVPVLATWRQWKQVYRFDLDFAKLLTETKESMTMPVEVLKSLPYPCIYIETAGIIDLDGVFVIRDHDTKTRTDILAFYGHTLKNPMGVEAPIEVNRLLLADGITVKQSIIPRIWPTQTTMTNGKVRIVEGLEKASADDRIAKKNEETAKKILQLVLYICAENAEIKADPVQERIRKEPKSEASGKPEIKDRMAEVKKMDVGAETGERIRIMGRKQKAGTSESSGTHHGSKSQKSPHMRSGHWHHYWRGKRNTEDRRLVVNWIAPVFINASLVDEDETVTINIAKKQKIRSTEQ